MSQQSDTLDALRVCLEVEPSPEAWIALCAQIDRHPTNAQLYQEVLPWLGEQLESWPDALRVAPMRWWEPAILGEETVLLWLCRKLTLRRAYPANPRTVPWILASPYIHNLTILDLPESHVNDDVARELARCPRLSNLRHLSLERNEVGAAGLGALAVSPHLSERLEVLHLGHNALHDDAMEVLRAPEAFPALRVLDLSDNWIGDSGLTLLARSPIVAHLVELDLTGNVSSAHGARWIRAAATRWPELKALRVERRGVDLAPRAGGLCNLPRLHVPDGAS